LPHSSSAWSGERGKKKKREEKKLRGEKGKKRRPVSRFFFVDAIFYGKKREEREGSPLPLRGGEREKKGPDRGKERGMKGPLIYPCTHARGREKEKGSALPHPWERKKGVTEKGEKRGKRRRCNCASVKREGRSYHIFAAS